MKKRFAVLCLCLGMLLVSACGSLSGATTAAGTAPGAETLPGNKMASGTAAETTPVMITTTAAISENPDETVTAGPATAEATTPAAAETTSPVASETEPPAASETVPPGTTERISEETTDAPAETPVTQDSAETTADGEDETFSEGTDTPCEIMAYRPYAGTLSSYFLQEGDRIAVISPATLPTRGETNAVLNGLRAWGYVPVEGQYACVASRTLEQCRADLVWALTDPSVKAVFCVRGGYGASEVMDSVSLDLIRSSRKLIIGYSDISIFHAAWSSAGLPSVHASMGRTFTDLPGECARATRQMMRGQTPVYRCAGSGYDRPGTAEGILIGGNLATVATALDTEYDCTALQQPYILFFEEVEEDLEHIHRFLTMLKHRGVLDNAAGIVFGEWIDIPRESETTDGSSRGGAYRSVADMIRRSFFPDADIPVAFGFPAGHGSLNYPLLLGEKVRLQVTSDAFTLEWTD